MTGAEMVGELLREYAAIIALVNEGSIKLGKLPEGIALPALVVAETSQVERQTLKRGDKVRTIDRVSVTGRFSNARERILIMGLVKQCCAGRVGDIAGGLSVSITTAGRGPDLNGPGNSFEKTQDFRVSYDALA